MPEPIAFTIPGRVGGKGRPRVSMRGRYPVVHSDPKTVNAEAMVRDFANRAMNGRPTLDGPVDLQIIILQEPPQSWSRRRREQTKWITGRPDLDNVAKLIGDALNGIVWRDDAQVASLRIQRCYVMSVGERVRVVIHDLSNDVPLFDSQPASAPLFREASA